MDPPAVTTDTTVDLPAARVVTVVSREATVASKVATEVVRVAMVVRAKVVTAVSRDTKSLASYFLCTTFLPYARTVTRHRYI